MLFGEIKKVVQTLTSKEREFDRRPIGVVNCHECKILAKREQEKFNDPNMFKAIANRSIN